MMHKVDVGDYGTARARDGEIAAGREFGQLNLVGVGEGVVTRRSSRIAILNIINNEVQRGAAQGRGRR